jgi:FkbM family methyltransferase
MRLLKVLTSGLIKFIYFNYHTKRIIKALKSLQKLQIFNILDIGAHRGETIKILLSAFNPSKIICFEPQQDNYHYLKNNFSENPKIELKNFALGDKIETKTLNVNADPGTSSLMQFNEKSKYLKLKSFLLGKKNYKDLILRKEEIDVYPLDSINFDFKNIDMIKIDVEGYEEKVLKGAEKTFVKNNIKIILIEFHLSKMFKEYNYNNLINLLEKNGYTLYKKIKFPLAFWEDRIYIKSL